MEKSINTALVQNLNGLSRLLAVFVFLLLAGSVFSQTISVQGVLRDPNGRSVDDGSYTVTFAIYDVATGGAALWTETYSSLQTKHGVFQANLGENTSLDGLAFDKTYYVGVTVESYAEMTPRIALTVYPYSKAILGQDNKFPSTGNIVLAKDSIIVQQGALKFEGADGRIVFNDGTSLNTANFSGPAGSLLNSSSININADNIADGLGAINFQIAGQTKALLENAGNFRVGDLAGSNTSILGNNIQGYSAGSSATLVLNGSGGFVSLGDRNGAYMETQSNTLQAYTNGGVSSTLYLNNSGGIVAVYDSIQVGEDNVRRGSITVNGSGTGNLGGILSLSSAATYPVDRWYMESLENDLLFGVVEGGVAGTKMTLQSNGEVGIGVSDSLRGTLNLHGSDVGESTGGFMRFYTSADGDDGGVNVFQMYADNDDFVLDRNNLGNIFFVDGATGNIGISDGDPTEARLVVRGTGSFSHSGFGYLNSTNPTGIAAAGTNVYSIFAENRVGAAEFNAFSDERIKEIVSVTNTQEDLKILEKIEITNYEFKDKIEQGSGLEKKVIAQQVERVYPLAVSKSAGMIPSVFELSEDVKYDSETGELTIRIDKAHEFEVGTITRLISENESLELNVLKVPDENTFVVKSDQAYDKIFVHGKKVNDFRSVDYDAISMLNVSATQELAKQVKALKLENEALRKKLEKIDLLEAKLNALLDPADATSDVQVGKE